MNEFQKNIISLYGGDGQKWLDALPEIIKEYQKKWNLGDVTTANNLTYNYVGLTSYRHPERSRGIQLKAQHMTGSLHSLSLGRDDERVDDQVLKVGFDSKSIQAELKALQHFNMLKIFAYDDHAILMERCVPGTTLEALVPEQDEKATSIAIELMKRMYMPEHLPYVIPEQAEGLNSGSTNHACTGSRVQACSLPRDDHNVGDLRNDNSHFSHISNWLKTIYQDHALPKEYMQNARLWADELLSTTNENVVLHGDFHHGNIIQCGEHHKAIDPKGVIGERAYDMACFIRNPLKVIMQNPHLIQKRIQQFCDAFEIDETRLIKWCFVHGMLSACWQIEDNQDPTDALTCCDLILLLTKHMKVEK